MLYPSETIHSVDEIEKYLHALGSRSILLGPQGAQESLLCAGLVYRPGQLRILLLKLHATSPNLQGGFAGPVSPKGPCWLWNWSCHLSSLGLILFLRNLAGSNGLFALS